MTKRKERFRTTLDDLAQRAKSTAQGAKTIGDSTAQKAKSVGETTTQGARAAGSAVVQGSEVTKDVVAQSAKSVGEVATRAGVVAGSAANQGMRVAGDGVGSIRQRATWDSVLPEQIRDNLADAIESSKTLSGSAKQKLIAQLEPALDRLSKDGMIDRTQAFAIIQGLMANPQISREINDWLHRLVDGRTVYDQAMDAVYNQTHIGGSYHRLFDGGHTLFGSFQATRDVAADDNIFKEAAELIQALARDATTTRGLPFFTWDQWNDGILKKENFESISRTLESILPVPKDWFYELNTYTVADLIVGMISILALALNWNNEDTEEFSKIVGSIGLSAIVNLINPAAKTNPLLLIVTVVALARAFHVARKSGDWKEFTDGLAKGGICTGAVLLTTSLMSGPMVVVLLSGICVGILAHQATKNVSFVEIGQFVIRQMGKDAKPEIA